MDWFNEAITIFKSDKPEHFGNYQHCGECEEHDDTLRRSDVFTIGIDELGSPGWDPMCFSKPAGKIYYMPAMIKLAVETLESEFYLSQLLFHLEGDGEGNELVKACSPQQRAFIVKFMDWVILIHSDKIEDQFYEHEAFRVRDIWSNT